MTDENPVFTEKEESLRDIPKPNAIDDRQCFFLFRLIINFEKHLTKAFQISYLGFVKHKKRNIMNELSHTQKTILSEAILREFNESNKFKFRQAELIKIAYQLHLAYVPEMIRLFNLKHKTNKTIESFAI